MVYECENCSSALPPGVTTCPKCGEPFDGPVPLDAEVKSAGWTAKPDSILTNTVAPTSAQPERIPNVPAMGPQCEPYPPSVPQTTTGGPRLGVLIGTIVLAGIVFLYFVGQANNPSYLKAEQPQVHPAQQVQQPNPPPKYGSALSTAEMSRREAVTAVFVQQGATVEALDDGAPHTFRIDLPAGDFTTAQAQDMAQMAHDRLGDNFVVRIYDHAHVLLAKAL